MEALYRKERFEEIYKDRLWDNSLRKANTETGQHSIMETIIKNYTDKKSSVLELGCGEGHFTKRIEQHVDFVFGLDISETAITRAKTNCRKDSNVHFSTGDMVHFLEDTTTNSFDCVLAMDVLYYLYPTRQHLRTELRQHMSQALKPNGYLIVTSCLNVPEGGEDVCRGFEEDFSLVKQFAGKDWNLWIWRNNK